MLSICNPVFRYIYRDPAERFLGYFASSKEITIMPFSTSMIHTVQFSDKPAQGKGTFSAKMFFPHQRNLFMVFCLLVAVLVMILGRTVPRSFSISPKKTPARLSFLHNVLKISDIM